MAGSITLICVVLGETPPADRIFTINVSPEDTIYELKLKILQDPACSTRSANPTTVSLLAPTTPIAIDSPLFDEAMIRFNVQEAQKLQSGFSLGQYPQLATPLPQHLHIVVAFPTRPPGHIVKPPLMVSRAIVSSVYTSFTSQYEGDTSFLSSVVQDVFAENNASRYSNSFAIVQSSGTGKSRMVDELAKSMFAFIICVREDDPPFNLSYPPPQSSIRKFLLKYHADGNEHPAALCLLRCLFQEAVSELDQLRGNPFKTRREVAKAWHAHLTNPGHRNDFYNKVANLAQTSINSHTTPLSDLDLSQLSQSCQNQHQNLISKIDSLITIASQSHETRGETAILVCIDEAHAIGQLDGLTTAFAHLKDQLVVGIYLSTAPQICTLTPLPRRIPSERANKTTHLLPFTELQLDPFARHYFHGRSCDMTLQTVRSIEAAASLGRPMWSAQLRTGYPICDLLQLAQVKLVGADGGQVPIEGKYAMLSCRLLIHFNQNEGSHLLSQTLVDSHMCFVYLFSEDRSNLLVRYPPEPFISAAAARMMSSRDEWKGWFRSMIAQNFIARDDRSALVSRVLLTMARDAAYAAERISTKDQFDLEPSDVLPGHEPVPLKAFLKAFLGMNHWNRVRQANPVNFSGGKPLDEFLDDAAVIDFTSFGICNSDKIFTYRGMIEALIQGVAIVCPPGQCWYDCVIVFLRDKNKSFLASNLGLVVLQDKKTTPIELPCGTKYPVISILHHPTAEQSRIEIEERQPDTDSLFMEGEPLYRIAVDGTPLVDRETCQEWWTGDDPVRCHRAGSGIAEAAQAIYRQNRYDAVADGLEFGFLSEVVKDV